MFKKSNQTLLTKYPLIWNLKYIWILLIALSINIIAFINGFFSFNDGSQLQDKYYSFNIFNSFETIFFYIFAICIIVIIWIFFYVKNNRFKLFYPTSRNYLFKEFLGVLSIFFLFLYIPNSYKLGLKKNVSRYMTEEEYLKDIDIINRVQPFTLQISNGYGNFSRNISVPIFDTLVTEKETRQLFKTNFAELKKKNPKANKEFLKPYFRNDEFEHLLAKHFPSRESTKTISFQKKYEPLNDNSSKNKYQDLDDDVTISHLTVDNDSILEFVDVTNNVISNNHIIKDKVYTNLESLYNYSYLPFYNVKDLDKNHEYYDRELINLLQKNDRKKIENLLNEYIKLLDKHKIGYRFNKGRWIDYIPKYPYYFIDYDLSSPNEYDRKNDNKDYINQDSLNSIYESIRIAKYESSWLENIKGNLIIALQLTVLLIIFRFSSFKVWLISIIGLGVLSIFFGLLYIIVDSILPYNYNLDKIILLSFYFISFFMILNGLRNKTNKLVTGVFLNWFTLASLYILYTILGFFTSKTFYDNLYTEVSKTISYINPILYIISFYFIINPYRKWQAMPEE